MHFIELSQLTSTDDKTSEILAPKPHNFENIISKLFDFKIIKIDKNRRISRMYTGTEAPILDSFK